MIKTTCCPQLKVPGPQPVKVFGSTPHLIRFFNDSVGYSRELFQTYGHLVSLSYGGGTNIYSPLPSCPGTLLAYGPELVRQVATQHEVYYKHPLTGKMYRNRDVSERTEPLKHFVVGLFGVNSDRHRQHRQLLMPAFHKQQIESYCNDIVAITQSILDALVVGGQTNIAEVMRLLTLRVVTKTLFGEDIGSSGRSIGRLLQDTLALLASPGMVLLPFDVPGLPYKKPT